MTSQQPVNKWIITITVMIGAFMSALNTSSVNVALPYIKGSLGTSVEDIAWVSTGYILSNVIIMPIIGMLSVRFGRKRLYLSCIVIFTVGSLLCALAWDLPSMITFRVIHGIGGGALIPIAQAILREVFPPDEQGTAMGIFGMGVVVGPAIGPLIGGWVTDNFSWHWIFYFNIPIGILNVFMVAKFINDPPYLKREKIKLDYLGLLFLIIGLGCFQVMLSKGEYKSWFESDFIRVLAAISAIGIILFIWRELKIDRPATNLRIMKDVNFSVGCFIASIMNMGLYGCLFLIPLFLQQLLGYPAYDSGLTMMPRSLAMAIVMPFAGRLYNKIGPRVFIGVGFAIIAFGIYQISNLSLSVGYWDLFVPQFVQGVGFGLVFVAITTATLSTIERRSLTEAAGLYNVIRQIFASIGISLAANAFSNRATFNRVMLVSHINDFSDRFLGWFGGARSLLLSKGYDTYNATDGALKLVDGLVMKQSAMLAYNHVFFLVSCVFILTIPFVFLLKKPNKTKNYRGGGYNE